MKAAVLWTGGKDCYLALHEARLAGWDVVLLATLAPPNARFRAHPLPVMARQARSLRLLHVVLDVEPPYAAGYRRAAARLRDSFGVRCLVTGDIDVPADHEDLVAATAAALGLQLVRPLWRRPRSELLAALLKLDAEVVVSCVRVEKLPAAWLGRRLDADAVAELCNLAAADALDACGEFGEYHTLVLHGPGFRERVVLHYDEALAGDGLRSLAIRSVHLEAPPCEPGRC
ncbi:MAG TPA: hypothetical protein VK348_10040 [Planctomycetota bacterium]|nr:hypothetical protein [Planctomycetota bacterium]